MAEAFAEEVLGSDVLERQEPAVLDREDLGDVDDVAERALDAVGIGDHREEGVDALDLRVPQVVAGAAGHRVVPRDVELLEQRDRTVAHVWKQVVSGVLDREADGIRAFEFAAARVVARLAGFLGQSGRAVLPGHREPVVSGGVGVRLPGTLPGQRR